MDANLGTTNLLLGIMAAVSVFEALVIIGIGIAGFVVYRRVMDLVTAIEARHVGPAMLRVNAILDDVQGVTARVRQETERVDEAIRATLERVDDTADRVRSNVRVKTSRLVGFVRGLRVALAGFLHPSRPQPSESATGRA